MPKLGMEPLRRAEIINASLECLCEVGIEKITLEMVAKKAGCSKGVIAYYFATKKQLTQEALKAFLNFYNKVVASEFTADMSPGQQLATVLRHTLPPMAGEPEDPPRPINVSNLAGPEKMYISPAKKAKLFVQFFAKAMTDIQLQTIVREVYGEYVDGMADIIEHGIDSGAYRPAAANRTAYGLLALIFDLNFFRVIGFTSPDGDDRPVCFEYLRNALQEAGGAE